MVPPTTGATATGIPRLYLHGNGAVRYFFTQNPAFDPAAFQVRVQQVSDLMDATNPDLGAFFACGELEGGVERGVKPSDQLELINREPMPPYSVVASKPMCRYPAYPRYVGTNPAGASVASDYVCSTS